MLGNKTLVLVIAVLAVGLFVLPSALSLFAGQHTFVRGATVDCAKCHQAEAGELSAGVAHADRTCGFCHQKAGGTEFPTGYDPTIQHAAISPPCVVCHNIAIGELQHPDEAHTEFYLAANNTEVTGSEILKDANEACIACHTMIGTAITWERAITLEFTAGHDATGWVVGNFNATGVNSTTTTSP